mmetsp:Transcript_11797/g.17306  ORF Transcript_11797/g.17306 Transcript_11797/m.17306 type:complete len:85 (+) Transcript_11797:585-839(+)
MLTSGLALLPAFEDFLSAEASNTSLSLRNIPPLLLVVNEREGAASGKCFGAALTDFINSRSVKIDNVWKFRMVILIMKEIFCGC